MVDAASPLKESRRDVLTQTLTGSDMVSEVYCSEQKSSEMNSSGTMRQKWVSKGHINFRVVPKISFSINLYERERGATFGS
jgi:hypothetical protein